MKRSSHSAMKTVNDSGFSNEQLTLASPKKLQFSDSSLMSDEENAGNGIERSLKRTKMTGGSSRRSFGDISVSSLNANIHSHQQQSSESPFRIASIDSLPNSNEIQECPTLESIGSDVGSDVSVSRLKGWLDDFGKQHRDHYERNNPGGLQKTSSVDSECESDVSVSKLKGWLDDFGKQHKQHYDRVNHTGKAPNGLSLTKPIRPKCAASSTPVVNKSATPAAKSYAYARPVASESRKGPIKTPIRFKPRYQKDEVQATNDGYASVQKLSAWLADDPTSTKKVCTVRKGMNVIAKSRKFEKDLANVVIEENDIVNGSVTNKSKWLQGAFNDKEENHVDVTDKKKWLEHAFQKGEDVNEDLITKGRDKVMSVNETKQRLQNAVKREEEKKRAKEVVATKGAGDSDAQCDEASLDNSTRKAQAIRGGSWVTRQTPAADIHLPSTSSEPPVAKKQAATLPSEKTTDTSIGNDAPVDFKAARQLLVQRSAENKNPVKILSKVEMKKKKFERLTQENRRKSAAHGLLKPTWDRADPAVGPTTSYTKSFVDDVAPKKAFEELP